MIEKFEIKNYKSCIDTKVDIHPQLTVLIGANGAGKTNILNALKIFSGIDRLRPAYLRSSAENLEFKADFNASIEIENAGKFALKSTLVYRLDDNKTDDVQSAAIKYKEISGKGSYQIIDKDTIEYTSYLKNSKAKINSSEKTSRKLDKTAVGLLKELQSVSYYGASLFTDPSQCPSVIDLEDLTLFDRNNRAAKPYTRFIFALYEEYKKQSPIFRQYISLVCRSGIELVDEIEIVEKNLPSKSYSLQPAADTIVTEKLNRLIVPYFIIDKQKLSPNQLSDGTFRTLALIFYIIRDDNKMLLIEEPEVSVHPGLLESMMQLILQESRNKQIILSTHSEVILDEVEPENVVLVQKNGAGTKANSLRKLLSKKDYAALKTYLAEAGNLGEYWREGGFGYE